MRLADMLLREDFYTILQMVEFTVNLKLLY